MIIKGAGINRRACQSKHNHGGFGLFLRTEYMHRLALPARLQQLSAMSAWRLASLKAYAATTTPITAPTSFAMLNTSVAKLILSGRTHRAFDGGRITSIAPIQATPTMATISRPTTAILKASPPRSPYRTTLHPNVTPGLRKRIKVVEWHLLCDAGVAVSTQRRLFRA